MDKYKKYREKLKAKKIIHEQNNGLELGYPGIRISDFVKEKILSGRTQILVVDEKILQFHKDCITGYWVNSTYHLRLHREKLRLALGLTKEQMEGLDVHHIDGNKDNNDMSNLQLINKTKHVVAHVKEQVRKKIIKVCEWCGEKYESPNNIAHRQRFCSAKCKAKYRRANGLNDTIRVCKRCGKEFVCDICSRTKFCSRRCAGIYNYKK